MPLRYSRAVERHTCAQREAEKGEVAWRRQSLALLRGRESCRGPGRTHAMQYETTIQADAVHGEHRRIRVSNVVSRPGQRRLPLSERLPLSDG